jgi:hypothetical protein
MPMGLLSLVPVLGERSLADRLRAYCAAVWGEDWTPGSEAALIGSACERANDRLPRQLTLDAWLRSHAARQHAKLFQDRPFLWWITDGRPDGFTIIAHYHRLDRANLERLAYTVLGDWIARLGDDPRTEAARASCKTNSPVSSKARRPTTSSFAGSRSIDSRSAGTLIWMMGCASISAPL